MTAYNRAPKKAVAHCPMHGCKWTRIYFDLLVRVGEFWPAKKRAEWGITGHILRAHRKASTLINGR
jgi:hypothetical protein